MKEKHKPTILIDTAEQKPIFIDGFEDNDLKFKKQHILTGDYIIEEVPNLVVIERKQNGIELYGNLTGKDKRRRFYNEVERMRQFTIKYILIQQSYADFLNPDNWYPLPFKKRFVAMAIVESSLINLQATEGISFVFAGNNCGRLAKRIFLKNYEYYKKGKINAPNITKF